MIRFPLKYSPARKQFTLTAGVQRGSGPMAHVSAEMIVDTGTNRSAISESVARQLGVDLNRLEMVSAGGITAIEERPTLPAVTLWLVGGDVARIPLENVLVLTKVHRRAKRSASGMKVRGEVSVEAPSLFGLDAVERLKARLTVDMRAGQAWLEW